MKKLALLLAIPLVLSCSKDSDGVEASQEKVLLQSTITTFPNGTILETQYSYNEDFLTKVVYSDGRSEEYTYDDEYLMQREDFNGATLTATHTYEYFNINRLKKYTIENENGISYFKYNYREDGITVVNTNDFYRNGMHDQDGRFEYTMSGKNINYLEAYRPLETYKRYAVDVIYDSRNSPMLNIKANVVLTSAALIGGEKNIRSLSRAGIDVNEIYETLYTYNEQGYPTQAVTTLNGDPAYTIEYHYN